MPVGAHWVPAKAALQWPYQWDPDEIEADFIKMQDLGFNTVRFDLFWAWFEPRPGDYNSEAFRQLDVLIELAHRTSIYLHPTLFIGGEVGEAYWDVAWRHGRHPHADPEMLRLQTDHAAEFARRYSHENAILAWDLTDEPPYWIAAKQTTDAMAVNWTRLIAGAIRRYDLEHPLCVGTSQQDIEHGPFRPDLLAAEVDFLSVHPYSIYALHLFPDPMLSERGTYCGAFQTALSGGAGRPVMIHELGASAAQYAPERIALFDRVTMYSSLAAGANGFLLWCFTDTTPTNYRSAPYLRAPHEIQFGLTTWDRSDRPAGKELRNFSQVFSNIDLSGIEPAPGEVALIVPHEWAKPHGDFSRMGLNGTGGSPYVSTQDGGAVSGLPEPELSDGNTWLMGSLLAAFVLCRRAGLKVDFPREYSQWQNRPLLMLPSPLTSTEQNLCHVHTSFWESVRAYVEQGGIVYASLCADAAIPNMDDLFGASLSDHTFAEDVRLKVVSPLGDLTPGIEFHYQSDRRDPHHWPVTLDVTRGQVIAVDQDQRPALIASSLGKGKTLLSAYPVETYLAATPSAFEAQENTHEWIRGLTTWAGLTPRLATDCPSVEVSGLVGQGRGYAVLANHRTEPQTVTVTAAEALQDAEIIASSGRKRIDLLDEHSWRLNIDSYGGALVSYRTIR